MQSSQTSENLRFDALESSAPQHFAGDSEVGLFGFTYLQKVNDLLSGRPLHTESGLWVTQPLTTYPPDSSWATGPQIVARMGSVRPGSTLLAQGVAERSSGAPQLSSTSARCAFPQFTPFNPMPLLQHELDKQLAEEYNFEETISISLSTAGSVLEGSTSSGASGRKADRSLVYATFWIEKVKHPNRHSFIQLQYAQLGWPQMSVATLRKVLD